MSKWGGGWYFGGRVKVKEVRGQGIMIKTHLYLNVEMRSPWVSFKCLHIVSLSPVK